MNDSVSVLMEKAHKTAEEHGWWRDDRSFGEVIALMHSELSEALEAFRDPLHAVSDLYSVNGKPEGVASEMADLLIRAFDACHHFGIPLAEALEAKMAYNETRPYRHGGKKL